MHILIYCPVMCGLFVVAKGDNTCVDRANRWSTLTS